MKKTIIEQIEIKRDGTVQVRFQLQVIDEGEIVASAWHRTSLPPGVNVDKQIEAVNGSLSLIGKAPVEKGCIDWLRPFVQSAHTPEAIASYQERLAEESRPA